MFKFKKEESKGQTLGPEKIPQILGNNLINKEDKDPDWVWQLKSVSRPKADNSQAFDVRIFSEGEATARRAKVKDYASLDKYPELILYEGWFDKDQVSLTAKQGADIGKKTNILTESELRQQIEALTAPGSTAFFYLAGSSASGGPLGRGAAVVELNPDYPGPKQKKYNVYIADVQGMQPVGKGQKFFGWDKAKEVAVWIKERHYKPSRI